MPSILHNDNTCRIQTVSPEQNPTLSKLIRAFNLGTPNHPPMLGNTSFNRAGEPLVHTIDDAINALKSDDFIEYLYLPEEGKLLISPTTNKKMKILGINISHHASSCLLVDNEIKFLLEDERVNRIKSYCPGLDDMDLFLDGEYEIHFAEELFKHTTHLDYIIFSSFDRNTFVK